MLKKDTEWQLDDNIVYLNHAAVSPWPQRTRRAVEQFAAENAALGSKNYLKWLQTERELRQHLKSLIDAPSSRDIALIKNTSEGLSFIAYGLNWQPGDNVVISDQEFPSNRIVWESLIPLGVEVRQADLMSAETPEAALMAHCDKRTRLLSISSVQYGSGLAVDLKSLGQFCRQQGILYCIDAIQSIGALPFSAQNCLADFVVADGHKWMLGPEGLGLFYSRAEVREQLQLRQFGWHMVEHQGDYDRNDWEAAKSARRFECGSPNMLGVHALHASISLLLDVGMEQVAAGIKDNVEYLRDRLCGLPNVEIVTDFSTDRYAGILLFKPHGHDLNKVYAQLMAANVMCAARCGGIRFSPHYYTQQRHLERAANQVERVLA